MRSKRYRAYNNYEVTIGKPYIFLVNGRKPAQATRRMFQSCGDPAFVRRAFTSPIHNGKKPKK